MRKLNKVIFIAILLITVVLPLSARKAMTVTWQWVLSDSAVTAYRYQMNDEKDGEWTVVDGTTSSFTAIGLDPYMDYTLYLQASYDGLHWSESATCVAYAVLSVDDVPVVDESVVLPYEGELKVDEVEPQVEEPAVEPATEPITEVEETPEPSIVRTIFYVYGYGVRNEWSEGYFKSEVIEDGIVTPSDILGFIEYEKEKYPDVFTSVNYDLIDNGFILTFDNALYDGSLIVGQYGDDLEEYIKLVTTPQEEAPVVESADFVIYDYTLHNTFDGTLFTSVLDDEYRDIVYTEDIEAFVEYEAEKYPVLTECFAVEKIEKGMLVLSVPSVLDFNLFVGEYKAEIIEFVTWYLTTLEKSEETVVEVVEEPPVVEEAPVEEVPLENVEVEIQIDAAAVEEEAKIPLAPSSVGARLLESQSLSSLKPSFTLGFNLGAEWGFVDGSVTGFPRFALTLEGRNLINTGKFGFGVRGDISSLLIPHKWIEDGYSFNLTNLFSSSEFGFDITADVKAMAYYNLDKTTFYFGLGAGYTIASADYTTTHTMQKLFSDKFNSAVIMTGVLGLDLRLGNHAAFTLESYSRAFIFNEVKSGTVGASIGMNFKF